MSRVLTMAIGLNPIRILRVAAELEPDLVLAITTPETAHLVFEVEQAARHLGLSCRFQSVPGDGYRFDADFAAVTAALSDPEIVGGLPADAMHMVIAGGTKPMVAAQVVAADALEWARTWFLDDHAGVLIEATGLQRRLSPSHVNLTPELLARMHAGLDAVPNSDMALASAPGQARDRIGWLLDRLRAPQHRDPNEESEYIAAKAELAVMELIRAIVPPDYDAHASLTVPLRDPTNPTHPVMEDARQGRRPRTFEVDGLVVRGTRAWVIENKFARLGLQAALVAAAELDVRRRHLAGDAATGVLVMLDDRVGKRFPAEVPAFELAGIRVVTRSTMITAAEVVLGGEDVARTELAGVFNADWGRV